MNGVSDTPALEYFAAANGYEGFRSLFEEIFDARGFQRLYVLKGGPGTGKSTLMRRISEHALHRGYKRESILCSSDPSSLDGIIVSSKVGNVGLVDGTAPHERDAMFPGAIDEIVNLGDGFDIKRLNSSRDKIVKLTERKKAAYRAAYFHLKSAGAIFDNIVNYSKSLSYYQAELTARRLCEAVPSGPRGLCKRIYSSAFCSKGYLRLPYNTAAKKQIVRVSSFLPEGHLTMSLIYDELSKRNAIRELHVSPLCDGIYERIVTDDAVFLVDDIDATFSTANTHAPSASLADRMLAAHSLMLGLAQEEFGRASKLHFELESIYNDCIDFKINDSLTERITRSIDEILG